MVDLQKSIRIEDIMSEISDVVYDRHVIKPQLASEVKWNMVAKCWQKQPVSPKYKSYHRTYIIWLPVCQKLHKNRKFTLQRSEISGHYSPDNRNLQHKDHKLVILTAQWSEISDSYSIMYTLTIESYSTSTGNSWSLQQGDQNLLILTAQTSNFTAWRS